MSKQSLPKIVDPIRYAGNGTDLHGSILVKDMPRLIPSLHSPEGEVETQMQFGVDRQGIKFLKGQAKAQLGMQCQRCMESFVYEIITDFAFGMVTTDAEAKELPGRYDPVVIVDDSLDLVEMVEEELIVNLPIVPMHDPKDCKVELPIVVLDDPTAPAMKENPFKVIESLKVKPKQE